MRVSASDQSHTGFALNEVFGTQGQVRLLRILTTETNGSISSPEAADRTGMTTSGARKALRRLSAAGVVEQIGAGKATRYVLRRDGELAAEIVRLFELERQNSGPRWARERRRGPSAFSNRGDGAAKTDGETDGSRVREPNRNGPSNTQRDLDPDSPEFNDALVSLLEEDLSLIRRAREKIQEKLQNRHPGNGHDDWEWRKILDTYPLPRLLHFLESDSPRAVRLRQSSPFPEVMSDRERERLGELIERPN